MQLAEHKEIVTLKKKPNKKKDMQFEMQFPFV